jgi:hypothetical protein
MPTLFHCRIQYDTGEIEELDLTEVINDEQMYLIDGQSGVNDART